MSAEPPSSPEINPYEPPRGEAEVGHEIADAPPQPGVAGWIATLLIWYQCAATLHGAWIATFQAISARWQGGDPSNLRLSFATTLLLAPVVIAVALAVAYAQYRAIIKKESAWAGRVAVTLFGLGLAQFVVGLFFAYSWMMQAEWVQVLVLGIVGPLYPLLLSYLMFRWYQRLKTYYATTAAANQKL